MGAIGIERLCFTTSKYFVDMRSLAIARGIDINKYYVGLGQKRMSVASPNEDIITLAYTVAEKVLEIYKDKSDVDLLVFGTESSVDQSKSAGTYIQYYMGLPANCNLFEVKQACYAGTAGLLVAYDYVYRNPSKKALVIASDIARYGAGTSGEPTQGCGAVAMIISANPKIISIEPIFGIHSEHCMDFWRPNNSQNAFVNGTLSLDMYLGSLQKSFIDFSKKSNLKKEDIDYYCYHTPFCKMVKKSHKMFLGIEPEYVDDQLQYSSDIGNCYTAALYVSLISLLEKHKKDLTNKRIGMYSYGSGSIGAFFTGVVQEGYKDHLLSDYHQGLIDRREEINCTQYEEMFFGFDGQEEIPQHYKTSGALSYCGIHDNKRVYDLIR